MCINYWDMVTFREKIHVDRSIILAKRQTKK